MKRKIGLPKKDSCERCEFKPIHYSQLDVHHQDHDPSNNKPSNLKTLCKNCHALEHGTRLSVSPEKAEELRVVVRTAGTRRREAEEEREAATALLVDEVVRARAAGLGPTELASLTGLSRQTIHAFLREAA